MTTVKRRATNDDHDLVRLYLNDAGQYPLLTKDDEARLAQEIEAGRTARAMLDDEKNKPTPTERRALRRRVRTGDEAHSVFVKSNLGLVVSIAKRYQASGVPLLDLIQEGNLGLIHAVDKFDWQRGFKFSTYATWWIRQAISRGIANTSRTIRLPVHAGDNLTKLHRARADLEVRFGRKATYAELAIELGTTEEKVRETALISAEPLSLSQKLSDDGDAELGDLVEDRGAPTPFEAAAASLLPAEVEKMLSQLDLRERRILSLRFGLDRGEPRTLEEVGEHFDLTRERIRQIEARAMSKLRHPTYAADVDALLGV
jgi:RNA polymerase sigma factor (sigma-70 family)